MDNRQYAYSPNFAKRRASCVFRSIWDEIVWRSVVAEIAAFKRTPCLVGTVIYSSNGTGLSELLVTSEVLARLAERGCTFSAYRISKKWYILDQINHTLADVIIE